jgi:hypothetical protein
LPFSILHRTVASPRESLAVGDKRLPSISDQQQQQQQQQLPWEECSQFDSTKLHCNLFWILWFPPAVKTHFHSRKFSTDRNFSENIIVKSQLQNYFPTENLCRPKQLGNLLRMRQISIETWRFPRRNNEMFVVVSIFLNACLIFIIFLLETKTK